MRVRNDTASSWSLRLRRSFTGLTCLLAAACGDGAGAASGGTGVAGTTVAGPGGGAGEGGADAVGGSGGDGGSEVGGGGAPASTTYLVGSGVYDVTGPPADLGMNGYADPLQTTAGMICGCAHALSSSPIPPSRCGGWRS